MDVLAASPPAPPHCPTPLGPLAGPREGKAGGAPRLKGQGLVFRPDAVCFQPAWQGPLPSPVICNISRHGSTSTPPPRPPAEGFTLPATELSVAKADNRAGGGGRVRFYCDILLRDGTVRAWGEATAAQRLSASPRGGGGRRAPQRGCRRLLQHFSEDQRTSTESSSGLFLACPLPACCLRGEGVGSGQSGSQA